MLMKPRHTLMVLLPALVLVAAVTANATNWRYRSAVACHFTPIAPPYGLTMVDPGDDVIRGALWNNHWQTKVASCPIETAAPGATIRNIVNYYITTAHDSTTADLAQVIARDPLSSSVATTPQKQQSTNGWKTIAFTSSDTVTLRSSPDGWEAYVSFTFAPGTHVTGYAWTD
jgi:hypothetical protein